MQIIFDEKLVPELKKRYVVLELDTVMQPEMTAPITLYALIDNIDLNTMTNLETLVSQHDELVRDYKKGNWDSAAFNANAMKGTWRGELDEFYDLVISTASEYGKTGDIWSGVRFTTPKE